MAMTSNQLTPNVDMQVHPDDQKTIENSNKKWAEMTSDKKAD